MRNKKSRKDRLFIYESIITTHRRVDNYSPRTVDDYNVHSSVMIPVTPVTKERFLWNSSRSRCPFLCGILLVAKCDFEYDNIRARRHARPLLYTHTVKQLTELPRPLWNPMRQKAEYDFTRALAHTRSFSYTHNVKQLNEVPAL